MDDGANLDFSVKRLHRTVCIGLPCIFLLYVCHFTEFLFFFNVQMLMQTHRLLKRHPRTRPQKGSVSRLSGYERGPEGHLVELGPS